MRPAAPGTGPDVDPGELLLSISSMIDYWHMGHAWMPPGRTPEEQAETRLREIQHLVMRSLCR